MRASRPKLARIRSFDLFNQNATKCSPVAVLKNSLYESNLQDKNLVGIKKAKSIFKFSVRVVENKEGFNLRRTG
jgi:hypothetical protein